MRTVGILAGYAVVIAGIFIFPQSPQGAALLIGLGIGIVAGIATN